MPKRTDISSILIIGSGPIVIGQACEFDYSGVQACKALRQEGYRVVLVNSNPATIMTDPELADATYIEPLTVEMLERIIAKERPDALLPTVGGQTGLNLGVALAEAGILAKYGVELIGANLRAMQVAEDRELFKEAMTAVGLESPRSGVARSLAEAHQIAQEIGRYPLFIRPSFTLGGSGAGTVFTPQEFDEKVAWGLKESPVHTVLVEESLIGWKEYELEVMRDRADNFVVVCSIENLDAMGVHTGDSITVAPAQTLTDKEYQRLRDQARLVMRAVGVETGGSNVQFGVDPQSGRVVIIEMNPRVSRSSALASKATGFPIAKLAAKVAVGYTLDELKNDITQQTVAAFEPSIDYVVVKFPRWAFEKFPGVDRTLGPQMKSVGEVMAIGRTFKEALQKAVRSLEIGRDGLGRLERDAEGPAQGLRRRHDACTICCAFPTATASLPSTRRCCGASRRPWSASSPATIRGLWRRWRKSSPLRSNCPAWTPHPAPGETAGVQRQPTGASAAPTGGWRAGDELELRALRQQLRDSAHLPPGGHLRRRIRGVYALSVQQLRNGERGAAHGAAQSADPGRRSQPHRPGDRVRLLLLPRLLCPPGTGLRDDHGQLQPGDGEHGLRHQRPALLRAADAGRCAEHL